MCYVVCTIYKHTSLSVTCVMLFHLFCHLRIQLHNTLEACTCQNVALIFKCIVGVYPSGSYERIYMPTVGLPLPYKLSSFNIPFFKPLLFKLVLSLWMKIQS